MNIRVIGVGLLFLLLQACDRPPAQTAAPSASPHAVAPSDAHSPTLVEARDGFATHLTSFVRAGDKVPTPPPSLFKLVRFPSGVGPLAAYLSPDPGDHKTHPAIIWIAGGDCNTVGDVWSPKPSSNDQSAAAFRQAGILMMFPSLRGGNTNPGYEEGFYGEVNDVISAADFLSSQSYVDTSRIYLGGHSTGGTLVLLVTEFAHRFRATFSFGPVADPTTYGPDFELPFNRKDTKEIVLRSPGNWLGSIQSPTFILEGDRAPSNIASLNLMARKSTSPDAHFLAIPGLSHFSDLAPANKLLAQKILKDTGETCNIAITPAELSALPH